MTTGRKPLPQPPERAGVSSRARQASIRRQAKKAVDVRRRRPILSES